MKKTLLTTIAITGLAFSALSQGTVFFDSSGNSDPTPTATSNGQFWSWTGPEGPVLLNSDINAILMAGPTAGSLLPISTLLISDTSALGDITFLGNGQFTDNSGQAYSVTGVGAAGTAVAEVIAWEGSYDTYAAAVAANSPHATSATFSVGPLGGGAVPPAYLGNMPAVVLTVPEPSTLALLGLGAAAMLIRRRQ
jgi:hypothetical protein